MSKEIARRREAVFAALNRCTQAMGEARWTNGYRAGSKDDGSQSWEKEKTQWSQCDPAEKTFKRALMAYMRAVRQANSQP